MQCCSHVLYPGNGCHKSAIRHSAAAGIQMALAERLVAPTLVEQLLGASISNFLAGQWKSINGQVEVREKVGRDKTGWKERNLEAA